MKKKIVLSALALTALAANTANAQDWQTGAANKLKTLVARIIKSETSIIGSTSTDGMNPNTTKPNQITTYAYNNGGWDKQLTTKTEYNNLGYVTATETISKEGKTRTENTYDDTLEGFVTKTTEYSWDEATNAWTNPTVTTEVELTRDGKGRVTKEVVYSLDEETNTMEKESEVDFEYGLISGKLNTISTTISMDEEGMEMSVPVKLTILKWYKYNEKKLFNISFDDMGSGMLTDKDNMIESANLTVTVQNMPITGTIKGSYTDTTSSLEISLMAGMMKLELTNNVTDSYGSNETTISMSGMGSSAISETVKTTNNEYGDCVRIETAGTDDDTESLKTRDLGDINLDDIDMNQTLTIDYEYLTTSDNGVLKKTMTVNALDKTTNEFKPTEKTVFDSYIDYVSGATGIHTTKNSPKTQNKAIYSVNGNKIKSMSATAEKSVYIVKDGNKTYKIAK